MLRCRSDSRMKTAARTMATTTKIDEKMAGQFVITPWVGLLPPGARFEANPHEVADIFTVRLTQLGDTRHHNRTTKTWGGNSYELPVITAGRHEIWGATHQITLNFLGVVDEVTRRG